MSVHVRIIRILLEFAKHPYVYRYIFQNARFVSSHSRAADGSSKFHIISTFGNTERIVHDKSALTSARTRKDDTEPRAAGDVCKRTQSYFRETRVELLFRAACVAACMRTCVPLVRPHGAYKRTRDISFNSPAVARASERFSERFGFGATRSGD